MNTHQSIRTTITLHPSVLQRFKEFAAREGKTLSEIVEDSVKRVIQKDQQLRLRQIYDTLKELDGAGGGVITYASTTINDVSYGEQGAWKGHDE